MNDSLWPDDTCRLSQLWSIASGKRMQFEGMVWAQSHPSLLPSGERVPERSRPQCPVLASNFATQRHLHWSLPEVITYTSTTHVVFLHACAALYFTTSVRLSVLPLSLSLADPDLGTSLALPHAARLSLLDCSPATLLCATP